VASNPIAYRPREVVNLGITRAGWSAKAYAILGTGRVRSDLPPASLLMKTLANAMGGMDRPHDHDCGFAIYHLADDGCYLLLTRFNNANNLAHRVWAVTRQGPELVLSPLGDERIIACVWELGLMHFEARAWIDCVLRQGLTDQTVAAYLAMRVEGPV
jgi:hypothetical protein